MERIERNYPEPKEEAPHDCVRCTCDAEYKYDDECYCLICLYEKLLEDGVIEEIE